jgi:hypothetical protein
MVSLFVNNFDETIFELIPIREFDVNQMQSA